MFIDRKDAALQLAKALEKYRDHDVVVLGIPRGGAETAYYVAKYLHAKLSLLIVRKLGYPQNPEFALGAIAEDGTIYYNPNARSRVSQEMAEYIEEQEQKEIDRRKNMLRLGKPFPDIKNKTVIIVDDGIATGATIFAGVELCHKKGAAKIIVAAPVAAPEKVVELEQVADEVTVLQTPADLQAVSQVYDYFYNLTDNEVLDIMEKWERKTIGN